MSRRLKTVEGRGTVIAPRKTATIEHSPTARISGTRLQAIRKRVLQAQPLCVECLRQGRTSLATEVDHKVPLWQGGSDDPWSDQNRQGLCRDCHKAKTKMDYLALGAKCDKTR